MDSDFGSFFSSFLLFSVVLVCLHVVPGLFCIWVAFESRSIVSVVWLWARENDIDVASGWKDTPKYSVEPTLEVLSSES